MAKITAKQFKAIKTAALFHAYYREELERDASVSQWEVWKRMRNERLKDAGFSTKQIEEF